MKRILLSIITITAFGFGANSQDVTIPDVNFKAYLVGNAAINTSGDSEIQVSEANVFNGSINCGGLSVSDLTGIESFIALTGLNCSNNSLTNLNVSQNIALDWIGCSANQLSVLDLTQNTALTIINCSNNSLSSLNVTLQTALTELNCNDNSLLTLNVANGNNTTISYFDATNNSSLTCIQVDDVAWSTTNWTNIDATSSFSLDCSTVGIDEFTDKQISLYPNPVNSQITIDSDEKFKSIVIMDAMGKKVETVVPTINTIDVSKLTNGIYFLEVHTDKGVVSKKFIKE